MSVFFDVNSTKQYKPWGKGLKDGFSQVVDWFWRYNHFQRLPEFVEVFGSANPEFYGVVVTGRSKDVQNTISGQERQAWLNNNISVAGKSILFLTYDDLFQKLSERLIYYRTTFDALNRLTNDQK